MLHPASRVHRDSTLALQATLPVEPACKLQPPVLGGGLVISTPVIESFDSEKPGDLITRKTRAREIVNLDQGWSMCL